MPKTMDKLLFFQLGMTPLHWAAQNGHAEVAAALVKNGAATNIMNKFELTPTDIAKQINRDDIIEIINMSVNDPSIVSQHLALQLVMESSNDSNPELEISKDTDSKEADTNCSVPLGKSKSSS